MTGLSYDREITALLVVDPYNDFISEGGLRVFYVARKHWCPSGFANTDLDQQLMVHGIHR
jgi:nicotinamidase-related amidase